eukprot:tig00020904_g15210.t1
MDLTEADVREAFQSMDFDHNGYVGAAEIMHFFTKCLGERVTDDEVDELVNVMDRDGDGQISFEEFFKLVTSERFSAQEPRTRFVSGDGGGGPGPADGGGGGGYGAQQQAYGAGRGASAWGSPGMAQQQQQQQQAMYQQQAQQQMSAMAAIGMGPGAAGGSGAVGQPAALEDPNAPANVSATLKQMNLSEFQRQFNLDQESIKRMYQNFQHADKRQSGLVNLTEFCALLGTQRSPLVENLFQLFDEDRSGLIDVREFMVGLANVSNAVKEDVCKLAFMLFDVDGNGIITRNELAQILKASHFANVRQIQRKVDWIMEQVDANRDGTMQYEEFVQLTQKFPNIVFPAFQLAELVASKAR